MDKKTVYQKLLTVQSNLVAPKGQFNSHGKFNYRSCEDIVDAVKPLLLEVGAVLIMSDKVEVRTSEIETYVEHKKDKPSEKVETLRAYVVATATFICVESGEKVEVTAEARETLTKAGMDSAQITGSASSYARKYALNGLFAIDDVKDADRGNPTLDSSQIATIKKEYSFEAVTECLKAYQVEMFSMLPHNSFESVLNWLNSYDMSNIKRIISSLLLTMPLPYVTNAINKYLGVQELKNANDRKKLYVFYEHLMSKIDSKTEKKEEKDASN